MRAALLCMFLAGCGSTVHVQRVEVPLPIPCIDRARVPAAPVSKFDALPLDSTLDGSVQALLIDREESGKYGRRLRALVESCVIQ